MNQQYLRNISLIVANPAGQGLELGAFRIVFAVRRGDIETPNSADITVYNLSDNTANLIDREFTQLSLKVSYGSAPVQQIFAGSIKQVRKGRENQLESYVAITGADGDEAYNFSGMALTLGAGATAADKLQAIIKAMATPAIVRANSGLPPAEAPVTQGNVPALSANGSVRGRVFYGTCRDEMRDLAAANDCKWSIQDGAVTLIPNTGYIPTDPVLLTPATGLIGIPEQTQNGLSVRVLINPSIKIGGRVQIQSTINPLRYGLDLAGSVAAQQLARSQTKLASDGMYYVMRVEHTGDTRGQSWYSDLICLAVDATAPVDNTTFQAAQVPFKSPRDAVPRY